MREDPIVNAPVTGLQLMLRTIALDGGLSAPVLPDGFYGDSTTRAVSDFQRANGLPVTGVTEEATFRAIVRAYNSAARRLAPAEPAVYHFPAGLVIGAGQSHPNLRLAQAMLEALGLADQAACGGTLTPSLSEQLRQVQRFSGLPVTGELDSGTWSQLARLYRATFDRDLPPSQG